MTRESLSADELGPVALRRSGPEGNKAGHAEDADNSSYVFRNAEETTAFDSVSRREFLPLGVIGLIRSQTIAAQYLQLKFSGPRPR